MFTDEKYPMKRMENLLELSSNVFSHLLSDAPFSSRVGKTHDPAAWKVSPFHCVLPGVCRWVLLGERRKKTSYLSSPNKSLLKNIIVITICLRFRKCFNVFSWAVASFPITWSVQCTASTNKTPQIQDATANKHTQFLAGATHILHQITQKLFAKGGWICSIFYSLVGGRENGNNQLWKPLNDAWKALSIANRAISADIIFHCEIKYIYIVF